MKNFNRQLKKMQPSASISRGLDSGNAKFNLAVGSPDIAPPDEIGAILREFAANPRWNYQPSKGTSKALNNLHAVVLNSNPEINPSENMALCPGAKTGIYLTLKTITNPGDVVILLQPHWLSYPDICISLGLEFISFEMNAAMDGSYDLQKLKEAIVNSKVRAIIINNPNNPAGTLMNPVEMDSLVEFCNEHQVLVLLDEVYKDLVFEPDQPLHEKYSKHDHVIRIGSLSKSLAFPGLRLGYVAGNRNFITNYNLFNQHIITSVSSMACVVSENLNRETYNRFTRHCSEEYHRRFGLAEAALKEKHYPVVHSQAAFYILVSLKPGSGSVEEFIHMLNSKGIIVTEGAHYGKQFSDYIRICLTLREPELKSVFELF
jgi:aspartate aminotransferase